VQEEKQNLKNVNSSSRKLMSFDAYWAVVSGALFRFLNIIIL
jgi:hypothetical protein